VIDFEPWRRVDQLPERAPIRHLRPDALPKPDQVRPRLEAEGLDPDSAGAILTAILRRDWTAWLVGVPGKPPRFTAFVLEPRFGAVWAQGWGATPAEAVRAALGSLSEPHRLATTLHYVDGYTVAEVAGLLGVPVGTVKRRLHDARRRLGQSPALRARGTQQEGTTMRLFTGKGDHGETDLLGGGRVGKDDPRVAVLGALDEATSAIGLGRALAASARAKELLVEVQRDLYRLMAGLAFAGAVRPAGYGLGPDRVARLEAVVDELGREVEIPPQFILAGDSAAGAALDVARAVARRAEREAVALARAGRLDDPQALRYLNRLSSFLFVLARFEDREAGVAPLRAKTTAS
jgi:cob(I)alamin adenosyltransferase